MKLFQIYKATNLINGKIYIGQTSRSIKFRITEHVSKRTLLGKALIKFGKINFKFETIDHAHSKSEADEKEKFWIKFYDCRVPNGYNIQEGGTGVGDLYVGEHNYFYGKRSEKAYNSIPVKCLETNKVFNSIKDAATFYGGDRSHLVKHLKGKYKSFKHLHFRYL